MTDGGPQPGDQPRFFGPGELTDLALLPGIVETLARELKINNELIRGDVAPCARRTELAVAELRQEQSLLFERLSTVEGRVDKVEGRATDLEEQASRTIPERIAALEARIGALERPRARVRKASTRVVAFPARKSKRK